MTYCINTRVKAVLFYNKIKSLRKTAKKFLCSKSTISNWINFVENRGLMPRRRKKTQFTVEKDIIMQYVSHKHFVTLGDIKNEIHSKMGKSPSITTIHKLLKKMGITRKRTKKIVYKNEEYMTDLSEKRKLFQEKIKLLPVDRIISIDETSTKIDMFMSYYYSKKGVIVKRGVSSQYHRNNSVLSAITTSGTLLTHIKTKAFNSTLFYEFMKEIVSSLQHQMYFILDNVGFHKTKKLQELIKNEGHVLLFIPPYSPEFNPIEYIFSQLKHSIKRTTPTRESDLHGLIHNFFDHLDSDNLYNCFQHAFHSDHSNFKTALKDRITTSI